MKNKLTRCSWATSTNDPLMIKYHDKEWGVPVFDDQELFEFLTLEGAQAGLSWATILDRREGYQLAFEDFDIERVATYTEQDISRLKNDKRIIRNELKIRSVITNAQQILKIKKDFGSFSDYIWNFVNHKPIKNTYKHETNIPSHTDLSKRMAKDLKHRGFKFVGKTICYAYMQAIGIVNDHIVDCFRYQEIIDQY